MTKKNSNDYDDQHNKLDAVSVLIGAGFVGIAVTTALVVYLVMRKPKMIEFPTVCDPSNRMPMYIHMNNQGGYCIVSNQIIISNFTIQNAGQPVFYLCTSGGTGKVPIYNYINNLDNVTVLWGTTYNAPAGYTVGNGGLPFGYAYSMKQLPNQQLSTLSVLQQIVKQSTVSILSTSNTKTYGAYTYNHKQTLGYVFPGQ
jgi:hypothetical protein